MKHSMKANKEIQSNFGIGKKNSFKDPHHDFYNSLVIKSKLNFVE